MKKLLSNQQGLAPVLLILLIVVVLAVIGSAGWFVYTRDDEKPRSSTGTSETEEVSDRSFAGSYFDAIDRGSALECDWRAPEGTAGDVQVGEGKFYTDGLSRGYSEGTFVVADQPATAYAIFDDNYVYNWFRLPSGPATGTRLARSELEASYEGMSAEEQQQAIDIRAQYSFDCQPWTVDENIFTPPADVPFQDIEA